MLHFYQNISVDWDCRVHASQCIDITLIMRLVDILIFRDIIINDMNRIGFVVFIQNTYFTCKSCCIAIMTAIYFNDSGTNCIIRAYLHIGCALHNVQHAGTIDCTCTGSMENIIVGFIAANAVQDKKVRIFYRGGKTSRNACHSSSDPRLQLSRIGLTGGDIGISIYAGIFLKALITVVAATADQIAR